MEHAEWEQICRHLSGKQYYASREGESCSKLTAHKVNMFLTLNVTYTGVLLINK